MLVEGMFLIDRYEILSKVGAGGMSDVYKAKDHILGRIVAIKVLKQEFSEDINFVTKFRTEAQSAAGLEHPNIVNVYDVGSENGLHFIVMEYIEGITLKTYVEKKGQLSFKEATSIAIQVARGIEAAHNKDITHRDIKPQNIMISTEGKVKVTDFGIAKAISSNTISSDAMGSVHYASPEQARNGFIDGRSDLYSLGIVMYEMVTGRVPFDGDTTVAVAIQHLQEEMVMPSVYAPDLPISYEKIILKCTQKNPERRYQTVVELLADLRQSLSTPDEDFVVIAPVVNSDTRIINGEELEAIQNSAEEADLDREYGYAESDDDDEDDEYDEYDEEYEYEYDDDDDDDNDDATGFLDPKVEKAVTIAGIVLFAIILILIGWLVFSIGANLMNFGKDNTEKPNTQQTESQETESESDKDSESETVEQVKMIDILGMSKEEAEKALSKIGLELSVMSEQEKEGVADGTILEQSEDEGTMVDKGSVIFVIVAGKNDNQVVSAVPDVVGEEEADAEKKLLDKGFRVSKEYAYDAEVEKGKVISQNPGANVKKTKGTRITIVISEGPETEKIPSNLVGKDAKEVQDALKELKFEVSIIEQYNADQEKGKVFDIKDAETEKSVVGADHPIGSTLKVYVSLGEEPGTEDVEDTESTEGNTGSEGSTETNGNAGSSENPGASENTGSETGSEENANNDAGSGASVEEESETQTQE